MRHEKFPKATARPISSRRVKAAERALKRERERHPLFADQVATEQPTAEQRLEQIEDATVAHWRRLRQHVATQWTKARTILFSLPLHEQRELLERWNNGPWPPSSAYFADFIHRSTGLSASREVLLIDGHWPGAEVRRLMRRYRVTIKALAASTGLTMKRIRAVRGEGLTDRLAIRDWIEAITGVDPGPL